MGESDPFAIPEPPMVTEPKVFKCRSNTCFGERNGDDKYCVECRHLINELTPKSSKVTDSPLKDQVGGNHYSKLAIQPIEYIYKNNIPFPEGNVIKYVTRWRGKDGIKDLQKAKHFIELLIELENDNVGKAD